MTALQDPRQRFYSHSDEIVLQFESLLVENLEWLSGHLARVEHELRVGIPPLELLIKTPGRPKSNAVFNLPSSHDAIPTAISTQSTNPFVVAQVATGPSKPAQITVEASQSRQEEYSSSRLRMSTASSTEDEEAIEASLTTSPAFRSTPKASKESRLPIARPQSPMLSPRLQKFCQKNPPVPTSKFSSPSAAASTQSRSPGKRTIPRPQSPISAITAHAATGPSPSTVSRPLMKPSEGVFSILDDRNRSLNPDNHTTMDIEMQEPSHSAPALDTASEALIEQDVPKEKALPSRFVEHQASSSTHAPLASSSKPPPSPITAFLTSHSSRPSALSFKGLPNREKSLGLAKNKLSFSARPTLHSSSLLDSDASMKRLKRTSDMLDTDPPERLSKITKTDRSSFQARSQAPQNRIEALMHKVQSMSKNVSTARYSSTVETSALLQIVDAVPEHVQAQTSEMFRSQPLNATSAQAAVDPGTSPSKAILASTSPKVKEAFKVFSHVIPSVRDDRKSPPHKDTPAQIASALVRHSSVTDLVRAFESRNAMHSPTLNRVSPKKMLVHSLSQVVDPTTSSTTPPHSPPTITSGPLMNALEVVAEVNVATNSGGLKDMQIDELSQASAPEADHLVEGMNISGETSKDFMDAEEEIDAPLSSIMPIDNLTNIDQLDGAADLPLEAQQSTHTAGHEKVDVPVITEPAKQIPARTFLAQATDLLTKSVASNPLQSLKKQSSIGGLKSLQMAAAAKEKEQALKEKKAAVKEEREQAKRLVNIAREQEEQRKRLVDIQNKGMQGGRKKAESNASRHQAPATSMTSTNKAKASSATTGLLAKNKVALSHSTSKKPDESKTNEEEEIARKLTVQSKSSAAHPLPGTTAGEKGKAKEVLRAPQPVTASKATLKIKSQAATCTDGSMPLVPSKDDRDILKSSQRSSKALAVALPSETYVELPDIASEYSDSDDEARADKASKLPDWAQSPELKAALMAQSRIDPDEIFGAIQPLHMEEMFKGKSSTRFRARTSSAYWSGADALTQAEEQAYAKRMNYAPAHASNLRE